MAEDFCSSLKLLGVVVILVRPGKMARAVLRALKPAVGELEGEMS